MTRLDKRLLELNLVPSRSKAQELIKSSFVMVNGKVINKPSFEVSDEEITIKENNTLNYVSRAGLKLEHAINEFHIIFKDKNILDIGASTGGFTDCALKHGAKKVVSVDVGTNQLASILKVDARVENLENTDFRDLSHEYFKNIDIITCDVSFISLTKVIEKIYHENIMVDCIFLIKPQFECGKEIADKYKGIILNKDIHYNILKNMINVMCDYNFNILGLDVSPIKGGDGNIEYICYVTTKPSKRININLDNIIEKAFNK